MIFGRYVSVSDELMAVCKQKPDRTGERGKERGRAWGERKEKVRRPQRKWFVKESQS